MASERKNDRVVAGVKNAKPLQEIFVDKFGKALFESGGLDSFLVELEERGKQFRLFAEPHYIERLMGSKFALRVHEFRISLGVWRNKDGTYGGILKEIEDDLRAARKRGEDTEDIRKIWPKFVSWAKDNLMDTFDPAKNKAWKHTKQVNNALAIVLPTQVRRHADIEFLCVFSGAKAPEVETRANVAAAFEESLGTATGVSDLLFDKQNELTRLKGTPLVIPEGAGNLERVALKTRRQSLIRREEDMLREAQRCWDRLEPWLVGRENEDGSSANSASAGNETDPASQKLFNKLDLSEADPEKHLASLKGLLTEATAANAPHLKVLGELVTAVAELVPVAKAAKEDILGILKRAARVATDKDVKGMRAQVTAINALRKACALDLKKTKVGARAAAR